MTVICIILRQWITKMWLEKKAKKTVEHSTRHYK